MATNLDLQIQLNQLIAEQNAFLEASVKLTKDQLSLTKDLVNAMRGADYKSLTTDVQGTSQAVAQATEQTKGFGSANQDVFDKVNNALKEAAAKEDAAGRGMATLTKQVKGFSQAANAVDGFVQGLRFTSNMIHTVVNAGTGLVESLANVGAAIISIPFKMLSGLIHMSDAGGSNNELRQALEDIRKEFGSLRETSGKAIVDMARSMKGELAGTGLSVTRIFGNLAERLKTLQEYAHNLGPLFSALAPQFVKNAEAIGAYYKGLGLTEEAQKAVAARSFALGTAITEELREITNYSQQLSKAFNGAAGSAKEISRDMGTLMADFKHFGGISTKEIGQAVVYFRRLGVEVSKVMGVIERYDNFEDAAQGAAQLSQAFGLNVDALQMMKAQNPAERVEMLRKSFFAAGRSVENMTRQERALLAQQTGLDDSALDLVFSMKNQGMSYDQVTKKADAAKKSQMTQAQAMKALADSIERLVKSGSSGAGGFVDRFIQGFTVGIQRSSEFREIMRNLRVDLRIAYTEGIKVGRAFVAMFPGVKDVFKGIADMFEPRRFREMFNKVTNTFKEFFRDMTTNPQTAVPKLLDRLKRDFFTWFDGNNQNGRKILDGFKRFFGAIADIAGGMLRVALNGIKNGVRLITDLLTGRQSISVNSGGALGFVGRLLSPIIEAVKDAGPALWDALKDMFGALRQRAEPWIRDNFLRVIGILAAPSLVGVAGRLIAGSVASAFAQGLMSWVSGGGVGRAFDAIRGRFAQQVSTATQAAQAAPRAPAGAGGAGQAVAGTVRGTEEAAQAAAGSRVNWGKALAQMALITTFIVVGMAGILYAIFRFAKAVQENKLTLTSIIGASTAMVTTAGALVAIAGSIKILSGININPGMAGKILAGVAIVGVVAGAMALGAYGMIKAFGDVPTSKIGKTVAMMGAMSTFFLAAAGITAVASLVGTMAVAGGGIGAAVIGAGLLTIAATVEVMVIQGMRVMRAIDQFHPGPGFTEKARAFVDIMTGVGRFAANVAQLAEATRPGIVDFLRGVGGEEQRRNLAAVNETIRNIGTQIVSIVESLRTSLDRLGGSEAQLRSAQALGSLLGGVAELGNALKPPTEALQESGWYTTLTGGGEDVTRKVAAVSEFVSTMGPQLRLFIARITEQFSAGGPLARGLSPEQQRGAEVVSQILRGVAEFANALRGGASTVLQLASGGQQETVLRAVGSYMNSLISSITQSQIFQRIGEVITSITAGVGNLNPGQVRAVQAIAPIIGPAFSTMAQFANIIASIVVPSQGPVQGNAGAIYQLIQLVNTFFQRIREDLPSLIQGMRTAFAGLSAQEAQRMAQGMEGLNRFFQTIGTIPTMLQAYRGVSGANAQTATTAQDLIRSIGLVRMLINGSGSSEGLLGVLRATIPALNTMTAEIGNPAQFTAKLGAVRGIFEVIAGIPAMIQNLSNISGSLASTGPAIENTINQIEHIQFARIGNVVTGMVREVNQLSSTIRSLPPIQIEQSLQRLGDTIGLGSEGSYTIQHRNFQINLDVTVKIDNNGLDALELALLNRTGPRPTRLIHTDGR